MDPTANAIERVGRSLALLKGTPAEGLHATARSELANLIQTTESVLAMLQVSQPLLAGAGGAAPERARALTPPPDGLDGFGSDSN